MTKTYIRQPKLARRWETSVRNIQLLRQQGKVPPPDMYLGQNPLWDVEGTIEPFERASVVNHVLKAKNKKPSSESSETAALGSETEDQQMNSA